jgi:hypothetical protein
MDILIFILTAIILYPVLGTIICILLTLYKSDNLKLKIVLLTLLRPLIYITILGIIFTSTFNNNPLWLFCFLVAVVVRDMVFGKDKYLSKLTATDDYISIEYINALLQTKHCNVTLDSKEFKLSEMRSVANYPASLTIVNSDNMQRFIIFNKETWNSANLSLNAANSRFAKVGLTN